MAFPHCFEFAVSIASPGFSTFLGIGLVIKLRVADRC